MRRIIAATGGRNEYGLLRTAVKALNGRCGLRCEVLAAGNHTEPRFGGTIREIERDDVPIAGVVEMIMPDDTNLSMARCLGQGVAAAAEALDSLDPALVLVLGDRFEALAVALAAYYRRTPIGHVHGGDVTRGGAMDDSARHATTKLSHLHLAATQQSADRIVRLGEEAWRVHVVGAPGLDAMAQGRHATKDEVCAQLDWDGQRPLILGTQHPNPAAPEAAADEATEVLEGACGLGLPTVFTYPNQDAGHQAIIDKLHEYREAHPQLRVRRSLGHRLYAGTLAAAAAVIGNSSSGLIETSLFGVPTVNVGERQKGRERAENVIDAACDRGAVRQALERCVYDDTFRETARGCSKPYGDGHAGERIADVIEGLDLRDPRLLRKQITY
jgi:GDP/UDP-N,N'-diacetylbacillosamine 2-epimerase (hydrolysing)